MNRRRTILLVILLVSAVTIGLIGARVWYRESSPTVALGDTTRAPQGQRVKVEVLNASGVSGLARRATFLLRDRGFDVVGWGNDPKGSRSQTLILDYTDKPEAADRLSRVLGGAQVERGQDSLDRGLDLTVKLGSGYRPSVEVFHP